ncbi:MAG: hypothetical protein R3183_11750, partial [Oleiphilaceae bacterium]|nr:hypothetical protein [Oleiphilaceae bacterium]
NETTVVGRTLNDVQLIPQTSNNNIHIATASLPSEQANIRARLHASGVEEIQPPLSNSMWTRKRSLLFREVPVDQIQLVSAETSITSAELNEPVLLDPVVYGYDEDASDGRGEPTAIIRDEVGRIQRIWEYDENYGVALVSKSFSSDDSYKLYYFNPADPEETEEGSEEPDNSTRAMVLMYDSENPPPRLN